MHARCVITQQQTAQKTNSKCVVVILYFYWETAMSVVMMTMKTKPLNCTSRLNNKSSGVLVTPVNWLQVSVTITGSWPSASSSGFKIFLKIHSPSQRSVDLWHPGQVIGRQTTFHTHSHVTLSVSCGTLPCARKPENQREPTSRLHPQRPLAWNQTSILAAVTWER